MKTAKVFKNGRSQAVRIPVEFRFDVDEVLIRKGERDGDVVLSPRPAVSQAERLRAAFVRLRAAGVSELIAPGDRDMSPPPDRVDFD